MKCYIHPDVDATGACTRCGKMICSSCSTEIDGRLVCRDCAASATTGTGYKSGDEAFCRSCGAVIKKEAEICPKCGVRQRVVVMTTAVGTKSKVVAALLAIFLGGLGAHKFYLGQTGMGIIYLCFCWTFIPAVIAFIEGIIYLTMSDEQFAIKYG